MVLETEIRADKAIFLQDFMKVMEQMEKQLADPNIPFAKRTALIRKMTQLKVDWQESGISSVDLVRALRDSLVNDWQTAGQMVLSGEAKNQIFGDIPGKIDRLNAILAKAKQKGIEGA